MAFLMCKDKIVYSTLMQKVEDEKLMPFDITKMTYNTWLKRRSYVSTNRYAEDLDKITKDKIDIKRKRLSLTDCYWIKRASDKTVSFEDITPYHNEFIRYDMLSGTLNSGSSTPDLQLGGSMLKYWKKQGDDIFIAKTLLKENIYAEMRAVALAKLLGICNYNAFTDEATPEIFIQNMTDETNMLLTFYSMGIKINGFSIKEVCEELLKLSIEEKSALHCALSWVIFDGIVGNWDRKSNMSNWGVFKNADTGEFSVCSIYDFNLAHYNIENMYIIDLTNQIKKDGYATQALEFINSWQNTVTEFNEPAWMANMNKMIYSLYNIKQC